MARKQGSSWRHVSDRDKALLWGRAAARCCHPDCKVFLIEPATAEDDDAMFGQAAHIVAHSDKGPRADPEYLAEQLDFYDNLILLCGNHHTIVDKQPNTYTSDDLRGWKSEHEAWVRRATEPQQYLPLPWTTIIQEDEPKIELPAVREALAPDIMDGEPHYLRFTPHPGGWQAAADAQASRLTQIMSSLPGERRRIAVFSLTNIPMAVHLGFMLTDRYRVALHQFDRDMASWKWPNDQVQTDFRFRETFAPGEEFGPAVVRVALSAEVAEPLTRELIHGPIADIEIAVHNPSVTWLRTPTQINELTALYRKALTRLRAQLGGRCTGLHLFYAGPTPGAIAIGRQHNPRMNPELHLYEYNRSKRPAYNQVLVLS